MYKFVFLFLVLLCLPCSAADVRMSNSVALGNKSFALLPFNGDMIDVWNPTTSQWETVHVPFGTMPYVGVYGFVNDAVITGCPGSPPVCVDVTHQDMPYNLPFHGFLKMDTSGNLYIAWVAFTSPKAGYWWGPKGFMVDNATGLGHLVAQVIRRPIWEIQGQANSQYLVSWYNRGQAAFVSIPSGSVGAGSGWQPVGTPVEIMIWEDDWPVVSATLNMTGSAVGASLQGAIVPNNSILNGAFGAATNAAPGNPYPVTIDFPATPTTPGFWTFQIFLQTNAGIVTLGAALNSTLTVTGKF